MKCKMHIFFQKHSSRVWQNCSCTISNFNLFVADQNKATKNILQQNGVYLKLGTAGQSQLPSNYRNYGDFISYHSAYYMYLCSALWKKSENEVWEGKQGRCLWCEHSHSTVPWLVCALNEERKGAVVTAAAMDNQALKRGPGNNHLPPKPAPKPGHVKVVRALYKYTAQQPDELSFQEGELLYVFDQVTDPSWWKARCGNKTGLIPANYVENQTEEVDHPLHEAARRGNLDFLLECLQQGVSGTGLDNAKNSPLYWASRGGHVDCVKKLLSLSYTALDAQNNFGDTPLHAAASHSHYEVVELLLAHNANTRLENKDGQTALDLAMNPAVINLIQMSRSTSRPNSNAVTYSADDYEDDSD